MPHLVATGLTGAALALLSPVPAGAAPAGAQAPPASLKLTISDPGGGASGQRSVTLTCGPSGGTHPRAAEACAELSRTGGVIERAPAPGAACTMIYAPVVAEATGHWDGRPVRFRGEYANQCALASKTGTVFRF
jgi:Subtilisin inhibitor-like